MPFLPSAVWPSVKKPNTTSLQSVTLGCRITFRMAPPLFHLFLQKWIYQWGKLDTILFHIEWKSGGAMRKLFQLHCLDMSELNCSDGLWSCFLYFIGGELLKHLWAMYQDREQLEHLSSPASRDIDGTLLQRDASLRLSRDCEQMGVEDLWICGVWTNIGVLAGFR